MTIFKKGEEIKTLYKKGEQIGSAYKSGYLVFSKGGRFELRGDINDNVVGGTLSPTSYSIEGEKGDTGTFIVTVSPNTNYTISPSSITGVSGVGNDITAPSVWVQSGNNVRGTFSYEFPNSGYGLNRTRTDNFTINGSATFDPPKYTFTINFVDNTGSNISFSTIPISVVGVAGSAISGSSTPTFTSGYVLNSLSASDNSTVIQTTATTFVSWTGTMPTGGGSATITITGSAKLFVPPTYSGNIIYNVNAQIQTSISPTSYSGQAGASVSYSGFLNANAGYEFNDGTTQKAVSGSITVPEGGGNVEVTFDDSVTVDCSNTTVFPSNLIYNSGAAQSQVLNISGSGYASTTGDASWITVTGSPGASQVTMTLTQNGGSARSDTFTINHSNTCTSSVFVSQTAFVDDAISLPATSNFSASGGINAVSFSSVGASNVVISDDMSWLTHTGPSGNSFNLIAQPNNGVQRSAIVTATKGSASDTMAVNQVGLAGATCSFYTFTHSGFGVGGYTTCDGEQVQSTLPNNFSACIQDGTAYVIGGDGVWTKGNVCS